MKVIFKRKGARFRKEGEVREFERFCFLPKIYTDKNKNKTTVFWMTRVKIIQSVEHCYDMCDAYSRWRTIEVKEVNK